MKFAAWFSIIVGGSMGLQWTFFIVTGQVPELSSEPIRIALHLVGEAATALVLIASGIALLRRVTWANGSAIFALGMLAYTAIVSSGYFAQQGIWAPVGMFAVILGIDIFCMLRLVAKPNKIGANR